MSFFCPGLELRSIIGHIRFVDDFCYILFEGSISQLGEFQQTVRFLEVGKIHSEAQARHDPPKLKVS